MINQIPSELKNKKRWPWIEETLPSTYDESIDWPKISIVTPSYNQGEFIEETIRSILLQNYPNLEYIIIDGGSTDETVDIIKKYENKIHYWVSVPDRGQAHAINKGLEKATGKLVNWINSDDYLEPEALQHVAEALIKHPNKQVFCGYTRCFWNENNKTSHKYRMGLKKNTTLTLLNIEMNQPGTFYKTTIFKELGGINESLNYVFDNELWMRFLCKYGQENVLLLKGLIAHFRQHDASKSFGDGFEEFHYEQNNIVYDLLKWTHADSLLIELFSKEKQTSNYKSEPWDLSKLNKNKFQAWFCNKYMVTLYNRGLKKEATACLKKAIQYRMFKPERKNLALIKKLVLK